MFSLWYALLSWKEYKKILIAPVPTNEENSEDMPEMKLKMPEIQPKAVNSVDPEPGRTESNPSPQLVAQSTPKPKPSTQNTMMETSFPNSMQNSTKAPLDPPPKPPRSPSPHPMRTEAYDIEYESDETEEEEEEDDEEDEEQNSVIASAVINEKLVPANSEDFLLAEKSSFNKESS